MTSWRDQLSQQAQDDLDDLLNVVLPFAEQTLGRYGELHPYGAARASDGSTVLLAADPGLGEHPPAQAVYDSLHEGARRDRDRFRAVAIASDVRIEDGSDAVRIDTEHREGVALTLLVEYALDRDAKTATLGEMYVIETDPVVWPGESPDG